MKKTSNYSLCQWDAGDRILRTDFNADNQKLDAALQSLANAKASASALSSLASRVSSLETVLPTKADASDAARIAVGTYTGDGATTRTLDFSATLGRAPKLVIIRQKASRGRGMVLIQGMTSTQDDMSTDANETYTAQVTWSANRVSWTARDATSMMNRSGGVFSWVAIG